MPGGGVQAHLGPWPRDFWLMAMGLSGPKWAYIFFIVSLAWACDETNFKLLLRNKYFKKKVKISVRFKGLRKTPPKFFFVLLACNVMKQTLGYHTLYVSYISKRFCCYNIFHIFKIVGNLTT